MRSVSRGANPWGSCRRRSPFPKRFREEGSGRTRARTKTQMSATRRSAGTTAAMRVRRSAPCARYRSRGSWRVGSRSVQRVDSVIIRKPASAPCAVRNIGPNACASRRPPMRNLDCTYSLTCARQRKPDGVRTWLNSQGAITRAIAGAPHAVAQWPLALVGRARTTKWRHRRLPTSPAARSSSHVICGQRSRPLRHCGTSWRGSSRSSDRRNVLRPRNSDGGVQ
jgi:hypothetical protein